MKYVKAVKSLRWKQAPPVPRFVEQVPKINKQQKQVTMYVEGGITMTQEEIVQLPKIIVQKLVVVPISPRERCLLHQVYHVVPPFTRTATVYHLM